MLILLYVDCFKLTSPKYKGNNYLQISNQTIDTEDPRNDKMDNQSVKAL